MVAGHWWTSDRCLSLCRILHYARALCAGSALKREIRYVLCGPWREAALQISFCLSVCPCALYPCLLIIHERKAEKLKIWPYEIGGSVLRSQLSQGQGHTRSSVSLSESAIEAYNKNKTIHRQFTFNKELVHSKFSLPCLSKVNRSKVKVVRSIFR